MTDLLATLDVENLYSKETMIHIDTMFKYKIEAGELEEMDILQLQRIVLYCNRVQLHNYIKKGKSGAQMLYDYLYEQIMEEKDYVNERPQIAYNYMNNYLREWRSKKTYSTADLQKVLNFVDQYFDLLANQHQMLREMLKKTLKRIEDDLKIDAHE